MPNGASAFPDPSAEPFILASVARLFRTIALTVASPFLMLTFLFFLLEKPLLWMLITGSIAVLILALGLVAFLVVRRKIRDVRRRLEEAGTFIEPFR